MYTFKYSSRAVKQLEKLDKSTKKLILKWIENNLVNCENPRSKGKGLKIGRASCRERV